jgi:hypothetical protein
MRKYFCFISICLSVNLYSQKGFYLRPIVEHKVHVNNDHPYDVTTAQGYTIRVTPINFYTSQGFDIGFYAGYRAKNCFFETGWSQDQGNQGVRLTATTFERYDNSFHKTEIVYSVGMEYNKYPFKIGLKLFGKDSISANKKLRWQCFLYGGIDLLTRPPIPAENGSGYVFITNKYGDSVIYESQLGSNIRWGRLNTIGLMLKAYNRKGRTVLNLSVHYSQGARNQQITFTSLKFTNYDGTVYKSWVGSKGSGLYFSVSTDIYPMNFFKKKQKQADYHKK